MTAWTSSFPPCFIAVDDHDKALAFYRDVLGLEVRNDVGFEGMRWVTVGAPSQPGVEIVLEPPLADPNASAADREAMAELLAKGLLRGVMFRTADCDATFERIRAAGAEVLQEPIDHALRRARLRLPRSLRQHAAVHPAERRLSSGRPGRQLARGRARPPVRVDAGGVEHGDGRVPGADEEVDLGAAQRIPSAPGRRAPHDAPVRRRATVDDRPGTAPRR